MALETYDDLVSTVADWLNRADLTAVIPTFVQLAEAGFNRDERFRASPLMARAQAAVHAQFISLPSDFIEMVNLRLLVDSVPTAGAPTLDYLPLAEFDERRARYRAAGQPVFYSIAGTQLEFLPAPSDLYTVEMLYHAKVPALGEANETNYILANHPDLYLYGALMQAAPYLKDDDRIATWATLYSAGADALKIASDRAQLGAAPLKMRSRSFG